MTAWLRDCWYLALPARALRRRRLVGKTMLGEPLVLGRADGGTVFALRDICPHRGIPLRHGWLDGDGVRCCYHGWKFACADGRCLDIPSLVPEQNIHLDRIRVTAPPVREVQGNVWVWFPRDPRAPLDPARLPPPPTVPDIGERTAKVSIAMDFACGIDDAALGLMDPTHAAFVHTSWWWRKNPRKVRVKEKSYVPHGAGFRMERIVLGEKGSKPYRLLGRNASTEITFELPGVRIEHARGDRHSVVALTAITPQTETSTEVHQFIYWTLPGLDVIRPVVRHLARIFLGQDRDVVVKQQEGLAYKPSLMLIDDADTQAKWYHRLKQEYLKAQEEGRPFRNPVEPRPLRYRS
jgi:phenylpropionate dioxygenase-like ring-hydroxylating dioxygenase large terminal subunit